ncbi:MAG: hypothetical protein KJ971_02490 [Firmicutes bacterium]|nr:hypothetical protein [Bacillota bacterium]
MKKQNKWILSFLFLFLLSFLLIGCTSQDELRRLDLMIQDGIQTTDNLDNISDEDLSETSVTTLSLSTYESQVMEMEFALLLTPSEKITQIRELHALILETHLSIADAKATLRISHQDLKNQITIFRESEQTLSEEDKTQLELLISEVKEINVVLKGTIGFAYRQMRDLRGMYQIENLDLILDTYKDVLDVLELRLTSIERINEILMEANEIIAGYLET